ncbi:antirestriction protein ArdA, partial [Listeria weihenstephanensis]
KLLAEYIKANPDSPSAKNHEGDFCDIGYVYGIRKIEIMYDGNVNRIPKNRKIAPIMEPFHTSNLSEEMQVKMKEILGNNEQVEGFQAYIGNVKALERDEVKGEWVAFPTDMETIQEVFERIELKSPFDYVCLGVQSDVKGLGGKIDTTIHLDTLNYLAEEIESLEYRDDDTLFIFESCLEAYKVNDSFDILNMIENTDCYRLAQNKHNMQEVANKYMGDMKLPKALSDRIHIDIQGASNEIKTSEAAYFTKNGFLERLRLPTQYYVSREDIPEDSRIFPVLKEINKEDVKRSVLAALEKTKDGKEPTKQNKSVKRDIER